MRIYWWWEEKQQAKIWVYLCDIILLRINVKKIIHSQGPIWKSLETNWFFIFYDGSVLTLILLFATVGSWLVLIGENGFSFITINLHGRVGNKVLSIFSLIIGFFRKVSLFGLKYYNFLTSYLLWRYVLDSLTLGARGPYYCEVIILQNLDFIIFYDKKYYEVLLPIKIAKINLQGYLYSNRTLLTIPIAFENILFIKE